MIKYPIIAARPQQQPEQLIQLVGFPHGLNTNKMAEMLLPTEMSECSDMKILKGGGIVTRPAMVKKTTTAISSEVYAVEQSSIGVIVSGSDYNVYKLDATPNPVLIDAVKGKPYLVNYNGVCIICDGDFLKYTDGTSIKIAYDDGEGSQFDNISGIADSVLSLDGTNLRVAVKFRTDTWTSDYTIPPTRAEFKLKKTGTPTGTVNINIRKVSDDSIIANSSIEADDILAGGGTYDCVFTVTTEYETLTDYYFSFEHVGDASNHVDIECTNETGDAYVYTGSWVADTTKQPIVKIWPGIAPKADFGCVWNKNLVIKNPDEPGRVYISNLTHLDWSSTGLAGWIGAVDENRNSYTVGAIKTLYSELYVFGTEDQPYISKLTGTSIVDFKLTPSFQRSWTTQRAVVNTSNDIWFNSFDGADSLSGVQQYGDLRTGSQSESVDNQFSNWDSTNSFAGYDSESGQMFLNMSGSKCLVCHVKLPVRGQGDILQFPWVEYNVPLEPSCFGTIDNKFIIGTADGFILENDNESTFDLDTTQIDPVFTTNYPQVPYPYTCLEGVQIIANSYKGGTICFNIFRNGSKTVPIQQIELPLPISDGLTVDEMTMPVSQANFAIDADAVSLHRDINIDVRSYMIKVDNMTLNNSPLFFNGLYLNHRRLE